MAGDDNNRLTKQLEQIAEDLSLKEYMARHRYICQVCGRPAQEVHHKKNINEANIWDTSITLNPDNLVLLCRDCHCNQHHKDRGNGNRKHGNANDKKEVKNGCKRIDKGG